MRVLGLLSTELSAEFRSLGGFGRVVVASLVELAAVLSSANDKVTAESNQIPIAIEGPKLWIRFTIFGYWFWQAHCCVGAGVQNTMRHPPVRGWTDIPQA